jgi:hypothetical protein
MTKSLVVVEIVIDRRNPSSLQKSVIIVKKAVILSGVWRGTLRQTQSKDPEEDKPA